MLQELATNTQSPTVSFVLSGHVGRENCDGMQVHKFLVCQVYRRTGNRRIVDYGQNGGGMMNCRCVMNNAHCFPSRFEGYLPPSRPNSAI